MKAGPRIYNLFPLLVGPVPAWHHHLGRTADMKFDWVFVNPFQHPGFSGSLYAIKDYYQLNPLFRDGTAKADDVLLAEFIAAAQQNGLSVMMDLVLNHTSKDSVIVERHPEWFQREADGSLRSPGAVDPDDPTIVTVWGDLAEIDYRDRPARDAIIRFWEGVVDHYARLGIRGFRGDAAYKVPAVVWHTIIANTRANHPGVVFFAETLGCQPSEIVALRDAGFDYIFNSAKWWDFKAPWLIEQYEKFRHIAPSIAFPESHDTERLRADLATQGVTEPEVIEAVYRQRYLFTAMFSTGVMMPIGYEFGFHRKLDVVRTRPEDWETPLFDLSAFIADVNRARSAIAPLNEEGPQRWVLPKDDGALAMLRSGGGDQWVLVIINPDRQRSHQIPTDGLVGLGASTAGVEVTPGHHAAGIKPHTNLRLQPLETRVFASEAKRPEHHGPEIAKA